MTRKAVPSVEYFTEALERSLLNINKRRVLLPVVVSGGAVGTNHMFIGTEVIRIISFYKTWKYFIPMACETMSVINA